MVKAEQISAELGKVLTLEFSEPKSLEVEMEQIWLSQRTPAKGGK